LIGLWGGRIGAELGPCSRGEGARCAADRHESDSFRAGEDPAQLIGTDAGHHSRAELELAVVRDEGRSTAERDVHLLLIGVDGIGAVVVMRVAAPAGWEREDLHSPGRYAELGARATSEAAVHRLHVVDRLDCYVRHRAPPWSSVTFWRFNSAALRN